jgi:hypothetical protein
VKKDAILEALKTLNNHYGKGDVKSFHMVDEVSGRVLIKTPFTQSTGYNYSRKFRIRNNTVYYAGHQRKIA